MAELAHAGVLARTPGEVPGAAIVERAGLRAVIVEGLAQFVVSVHPASCEQPQAMAFTRALQDTAGTPLPRTPNTRAGEHTQAIWLAPGRWLLVCAEHSRQSLAARLQAALESVDATAIAASVSDASDAWLVLEVSGRRRHELMAMGCSLDLAAGQFAAPRTARTLFAGASALLYPLGDGFRVHLDSTLAVFLCAWLRQSALLLD